MAYSRRDSLRVLASLAAGGVASSVLPREQWAASFAAASPTAHPSSLAGSNPAARQPGKVPVIYYTDLFHPPDDPDDHVDLVTLFSLPELDVRAIILDLGHQQRAKPGDVPVKQMAALTGRKAPFAAGLPGPLRHPEDKAENQHFGPFRLDGGVELILQTLRQCERKAYIFTTGSVREVAAAFNRDEALFRSKVERVYVNAGDSSGPPAEWNTWLDPQAYIRLMSSDLPVYWCPCFGPGTSFDALRDGVQKPQPYATYWKFVQRDVYDALPRPLQNYFIYALSGKIAEQEDPVKYLSRVPEEDLKQKIWSAKRNMWCTGPLIHAAGRKLYRRGDTWAALASPEPGYELSQVCDFVPAKVTIDREMNTTLDVSDTGGPFKIFHPVDLENYEKAMTTALRKLLSEMPLALGS